MRRIFIYFVLSSIFLSSAFSQDSNTISDFAISPIYSLDAKSSIDYDSIWCFHPFSINLYSGLWTPIDKLSEFYKPSVKLGASFGLMIFKRVKIELGLNMIFHRKKNDLELFADGLAKSTGKTTGASLGGLVTYSVYSDKNVYIDLLSGLTWETIDTDIINPESDPRDEYDDHLSVSTFGVSFGTDVWLNKFGSHNVGLRVLYCYAPYNKDAVLYTKIGGQSISTSLIYRFPRRNQMFRKYF